MINSKQAAKITKNQHHRLILQYYKHAGFYLQLKPRQFELIKFRKQDVTEKQKLHGFETAIPLRGSRKALVFN